MRRQQIWPFPVGDASPDYEPTDTELAGQGINIYPSDPGNSPSYTTLTTSKGPTK